MNVCISVPELTSCILVFQTKVELLERLEMGGLQHTVVYDYSY